MVKIIDLEAHFFTKSIIDYANTKQAKASNPVEDLLLDIENQRLKAMDEAGIDIQLLSLNLTVPRIQDWEASEAVIWAGKTNDELAGIINKHPDRFMGLATIAPQDPKASAAEIERAVTKLGFKGAIIQGHSRNEYLDDRKFWPIFEKAAQLGVPVFIHPTTPSNLILKGFEPYGQPLWSAPLGFGFEVSLHAMRLIYSGVFDQYPSLKVVLGHMGEALPFWLSRIDFQFLRPGQQKPKIQRKPSDYIKHNFTITTSGVFYPPALICALLSLGADRIAFAVDYPWEDNLEGVEFLKHATINEDDREKIFHLTAERLLKM